MSKHTQQFFEDLKTGKSPGLVERIAEAASAAKELGGQIWDAGKPMFDHGRTELAAALFSGHAHVMYMKGAGGVERARGADSDKTLEDPDTHALPEQTRDLGREM